MKRIAALSLALALATSSFGQNIPLVITGPLSDDIANRANDITFVFSRFGQSPAANVGWGFNPPDSFRLTLDLSNAESFQHSYGVQLFKGVAPSIYTPGPYVRLNSPYLLVIPGGFSYQLQKGITYRLGIYDVLISDPADAATEDVHLRYTEQQNGGGGGGTGGGGGAGGGGGTGGGGSSGGVVAGGGAGSTTDVVPPGTGKAIGLLGLLPVDAIVSGLLPRNIDANPATAQRMLDEMMHAVLHEGGGTGFAEEEAGVSSDGKHLIAPDREWNVWIRTYGGSLPGNGGKFYQNNWEGIAGGLALGVERQFGAHFTAGLFGSYGRMNVEQEGLGGGQWTPDAFGGGVYARWDNSKWFVGAAFAGQYFEGQQSRGINYPGLNLTASGDRAATSFTTALQVGRRINAGAGFVVTPSFLADWSIIAEDGFTESGADIPFAGRTFKFSNLEYADRTTQWLSTDLGVTLSRPIKLGKNTLTPSVRTAWRGIWQIQDDTQTIDYRFTRRSLNVDGPWEDQQNLSLGGALDFATAGGFSAYLRGEAFIVGEASFVTSAGVSYRF